FPLIVNDGEEFAATDWPLAGTIATIAKLDANPFNLAARSPPPDTPGVRRYPGTRGADCPARPRMRDPERIRPAADLMPPPFRRRNAPGLVSWEIGATDHDRRRAMRSWSLSLLLMALAGASPPERPSDDNPPERQAHQAVQRGIGFLEKEGLAWMKKQQCAS